jgi:hypothetical protein
LAAIELGNNRTWRQKKNLAAKEKLGGKRTSTIERFRWLDT